MPDAGKRPETAETRPSAGARGASDRIVSGLAVLAALLILADAFYDKHAKFAIEDLFGFYGLFGFLSCAAAIAAARIVLGPLRRSEDHYERNAGDGE